MKEDSVRIIITDRIKISGNSRAQLILEFPFINDQPSLCVASVLKEYIHTIINIRPSNADTLFLSFKTP